MKALRQLKENEMLVQLIYKSVAEENFCRKVLVDILNVSRRNNQRVNITGMLLFADNSFLQVLEGEADDVESLYQKIKQDQRNRDVTVIIEEPIAERSFADWSMGYADLSIDEIGEITGTNDLFIGSRAFSRIEEGRAKKLISAFKQGRWRERVGELDPSKEEVLVHSAETRPLANFLPASASKPPADKDYTFAFQPILDVNKEQVFSYEALLRGKNNESALEILEDVHTADINVFDNQCNLHAIHLAAHLGLSTHLNLNIIPSSMTRLPEAITEILESLDKFNILPQQIILEILENEVIEDISAFLQATYQYRDSGLRFAIDDFGAGYAGLNLLAEFQPDYIKLDRELIAGVHDKGPRQAIVFGILRTCFDLGIDIIAEGIESREEYLWLKDAGISLMQGFFLAKPAFEQLHTQFHLPEAVE